MPISAATPTWPRAGDGEAWNLHATAVVGIYPQGASPYGVQDLTGNVWEWCLNGYAEPDVLAADVDPDDDADRVLRGGSWVSVPGRARATSRMRGRPGESPVGRGLRVLCESAIPPADVGD